MSDRDEWTVAEEQARYYEDHFSSVNYLGSAGFATRMIHRSLERGLSSERHLSTVLELGSAHGEHVAYVRHSFDRYLVTDLVDRDLDLARLAESLPEGGGRRELEFHVQDATRLEVPAASIDRVLHTCLLHHVRDLDSVFAEIRRVLRSGGLYTAYIPCDPGLVYRAAQRVTAGRAIRRVLRRGGYSLTPGLLRAMEHPNHYASVWNVLRHSFRADRIITRHFPFPGALWNLNFFSVVNIVRGELESSPSR
jgi:phosphatidylethanolamine/phosphatidyl-N-methylethanolamine N-methyltransferase